MEAEGGTDNGGGAQSVKDAGGLVLRQAVLPRQLLHLVFNRKGLDIEDERHRELGLGKGRGQHGNPTPVPTPVPPLPRLTFGSIASGCSENDKNGTMDGGAAEISRVLTEFYCNCDDVRQLYSSTSIAKTDLCGISSPPKKKKKKQKRQG